MRQTPDDRVIAAQCGLNRDGINDDIRRASSGLVFVRPPPRRSKGRTPAENMQSSSTIRRSEGRFRLTADHWLHMPVSLWRRLHEPASLAYLLHPLAAIQPPDDGLLNRVPPRSPPAFTRAGRLPLLWPRPCSTGIASRLERQQASFQQIAAVRNVRSWAPDIGQPCFGKFYCLSAVQNMSRGPSRPS